MTYKDIRLTLSFVWETLNSVIDYRYIRYKTRTKNKEFNICCKALYRQVAYDDYHWIEMLELKYQYEQMETPFHRVMKSLIYTVVQKH